ncbi:hypothetical protein M8818_000949 [Zalaria obscura]|uniref:Uncharacterized protein n=1 Tax=Zalaria obscura TaxID=2024903 RepID=A0ACC3SL67_9PEZI
MKKVERYNIIQLYGLIDKLSGPATRVCPTSRKSQLRTSRHLIYARARWEDWTMPLYAGIKAWNEGMNSVPWMGPVLKVVACFAVLWVVKRYFQGARTRAERNMHSKVVMITVGLSSQYDGMSHSDKLQGGTSGVGEEIIRALATRGAQIILLTQHSLSDPFLVDFIEDMRTSTNNELITAEQVDLTSLYSIRTFATKWIDNAPPRRLDMIILCANTLTPKGGKIQVTDDGVELNWAVNYLANFHLLSILSPAIRAQPADRDVRILFGHCSAYLGGSLPVAAGPATEGEENETETKGSKKGKKKDKTTTPPARPKEATTKFRPWQAYATSKLALATFAHAFQKHLSAYARPDKLPMNARVVLVDPGFTRTPGMRRYLTRGSLLGLFLYLLSYPFWWFVLKSPEQGAQNFLHAAMEAEFGEGEGGWLIKECQEVGIARAEVRDEGVQGELWKYSEGMIVEAEKRGKVVRDRKRREAEEREKTEKERVEREKVEKKGPKAKEEKREGSRRSKKSGK